GVELQRETRKLCVALSDQLRVHIRNEGRLATRCSVAVGRMGSDELARLALEHHVDQEDLRVLINALAHEGNGWAAHAGPLLLNLIASVKRQMEAQETELFPFMERALGANGHGNGAVRMEGGGGNE